MLKRKEVHEQNNLEIPVMTTDRTSHHSRFSNQSSSNSAGNNTHQTNLLNQFKGKPQLKAIIRIQALVRGLIVRQRLNKLTQFRNAVSLIQRWVRGIQTRQRLRR